MLTITVPGGEAYNEKENKFIVIKPCTLKLEHSLLSLYKWESRNHKYFLNNKDITDDEMIDYIKCMTINSAEVEDYIYDYLSKENIHQITEYIKDPMSATTFSDTNKNVSSSGYITAELIYSAMIILNIPIDIFERRHLNHLITLIRVCDEKQNPDKQQTISTHALAKHYSELNKARKAKLGTRG